MQNSLRLNTYFPVLDISLSKDQLRKVALVKLLAQCIHLVGSPGFSPQHQDKQQQNVQAQMLHFLLKTPSQTKLVKGTGGVNEKLPQPHPHFPKETQSSNFSEAPYDSTRSVSSIAVSTSITRFVFVVLEIEPKASNMLKECSATELQSLLFFFLSLLGQKELSEK